MRPRPLPSASSTVIHTHTCIVHDDPSATHRAWKRYDCAVLPLVWMCHGRASYATRGRGVAVGIHPVLRLGHSTLYRRCAHELTTTCSGAVLVCWRGTCRVRLVGTSFAFFAADERRACSTLLVSPVESSRLVTCVRYVSCLSLVTVTVLSVLNCVHCPLSC